MSQVGVHEKGMFHESKNGFFFVFFVLATCFLTFLITNNHVDSIVNVTRQTLSAVATVAVWDAKTWEIPTTNPAEVVLVLEWK